MTFTKSKKVPKLIFLKKFLKHGTRIASVAPSSTVLAKEMCRYVDPYKPQVIVELGTGTGAFTKIISQKMHQRSRLIGFEIDEQFADITENICPQATIVRKSACQIKEELEKLNIFHADLLISGLSTPTIPQEINIKVLSFLSSQKEDFIFSQLTEIPWYYYKKYKRLFHEVKFKFVARNIPPAGIYHCKHLKENFRNHIPGKKKELVL